MWQRAQQQFEPQQACKWMVSVLRLAYDYDCESPLAAELLQQAPLPELNVLQTRFLPHRTPPNTPSRQHAVDAYDQLLNGSWTSQEGLHV